MEARPARRRCWIRRAGDAEDARAKEGDFFAADAGVWSEAPRGNEGMVRMRPYTDASIQWLIYLVEQTFLSASRCTRAEYIGRSREEYLARGRQECLPTMLDPLHLRVGG